MASYYLKGYTTPDGVNSRADVREWQNKLGVKADGIWGPNTQAAYERYANASSMSKFQEYYDTILGALNVPSISVSVPSKAELKEDISSYLRPGVDLAISKRRAAGETAKAELDADAVSRGMGASTYVSSMKEREDDDTQSDISIMEAQYTATLAERIAAALEKYGNVKPDSVIIRLVAGAAERAVRIQRADHGDEFGLPMVQFIYEQRGARR